MYSGDLARVIKTFVDEQHTKSFNVAPDVNLSVYDIALIALKACDAQHMAIKYDASKPNGQQRKDVDTVTLKSCMPTIEFRDLAAGIRNIYDIENLNES